MSFAFAIAISTALDYIVKRLEILANQRFMRLSFRNSFEAVKNHARSRETHNS